MTLVECGLQSEKFDALGVIRSNSFTVNKILMFHCLDCLKNRSKIPRGSKILCKSHPRMHSVINNKAIYSTCDFIFWKFHPHLF